MGRRAFWLCLATLLLLAASLGIPNGLAREKSARQQGEELLARAVDVSNLRSPTTPAFRLLATLHLFGTQGQTIEGTYSLVWNSESQWREEVHFPGYDRLRVGAAGRYWQLRSQPEEAIRIRQIDQTIHFASSLFIGPKQKPGRPKKALMKDREAVCFSPDTDSRLQPELCFDSMSGGLLREKNAIGFFNTGGDRHEREFGEWVEWEGKIFPKLMKMYEGGRLAIEVRITELRRHEERASERFTRPMNSQEWGWCPEPDSWVKTRHVPPQYPVEARRGRITGTVIVYAVIERDGAVSSLKVVESAGEYLDRATLDAVRQWRYEPKTCSGVPVQSEVFISVNFSIS